jgi:hypothetical protein
MQGGLLMNKYIYLIFYQLNNQSDINTGKPAIIRNKDIKGFFKNTKIFILSRIELESFRHATCRD